jgi:hypothetical protein
MQSMSTMSKVWHIEQFKGVMRHMKLLSMNRRLFWMHIAVERLSRKLVELLFVERHGATAIFQCSHLLNDGFVL